MKMQMVAALVVLSSAAFATSPRKLGTEPLVIQEISQMQNLMPGPSARPKPIRTVIRAEVMSGGCTKADDFQVFVNTVGTQQSIAIERVTPDLCELVAFPTTIELESYDLRLSSKAPVYVVNPLRVAETVAH